MVFKSCCSLALWTKVALPMLRKKAASALEGLNDFQKSLRPCALDEGCLSIGRVK